MVRTNTDIELLKNKCTGKGYSALLGLDNTKLLDFLARYIKLCNPASVFVRTDADEDAEYIRTRAIEKGEEAPLSIAGHTVHFDGFHDQARDKENTKYLLSAGEGHGPYINSTDRDKGLDEVHGFLKDSMDNKEAYICFLCLGPVDSEFSIPAVQITDSCYVAHSEDILYRRGYEEFKKHAEKRGFFKFVHSAGELEGSVSKNIDKRRVYIDLENNTVFSTKIFQYVWRVDCQRKG